MVNTRVILATSAGLACVVLAANVLVVSDGFGMLHDGLKNAPAQAQVSVRALREANVAGNVGILLFLLVHLLFAAAFVAFDRNPRRTISSKLLRYVVAAITTLICSYSLALWFLDAGRISGFRMLQKVLEHMIESLAAAYAR